MSIRLHNFMTYDDCEIQPGPGMNLVLGPNGTGKSSIVSAICVGLNGNPKLLGRATRVLDYIKQGKHDAYIEIELFSRQGQNTVIRRSFRRSQKTSDWKINGKSTGAEEVKQLIHSLNIQLDNMTQFLPQEKVASFAMMGPVDLLKATEEAVLPPESVEYHNKLTDLKKNYLTKQSSVEETRRHLETLKRKNETLEKLVQQFREREEHLKRIDLLNVKKPFVLFQDKQAECNETKKLQIIAERELAQVEADLAPLERKIAAMEQDKLTVHREYSAVVQRIKATRETLSATVKRMEKSREQLEEKQSKIEELETKVRDREQRKKRAENDLNRYRDELEKRESDEELDRRVRDAEEQKRALDARSSELQNKLYESRERVTGKQRELRDIDGEIKQLESIRERRMTVLEKFSTHTYNACRWLQKNKHMFQKNVYCVALDVSIPSAEHAKYLEQHCPSWLLTAFVCEDEADKERLMVELSEKQKIQVNAIYRPSHDLSLPPNPIPRDEAAQLGITGFLDETFTAPPIVKKVMSESAMIEKVAIGIANINYDKVYADRNLRVSNIFTPTAYYVARRSAYSGQISIRVNQVKNPVLFTGQDFNKLDELRNRRVAIAAELDQMRTSVHTIEQEDQKYSNEREKLRNIRSTVAIAKKERNSLQQKVQQKDRELRELSKGLNVEEQKLAIQQEIRREYMQMATTLMQVGESMKTWNELNTECTKGPIKRAIIDNKLQEQRRALAESRRAVDQKRTEVTRIKTDVRAMISTLKDLRDAAMKARNAYAKKYDIEDAEETVNGLLLTLPNTLDEVEMMIADEKGAADSIFHDPSVIEAYEKRKKDIERIEVELGALVRELDEYNNDLGSLQDKWLRPLERCIAKIDATFQRLCRNIGIVGQVALNPNEDYDKYEVQLKVKFRDDEQLAVLSSTRQSGGERAVTTILYLLSLQHLNKCPFRVVDEINQGMDPTNERKIFYQMLESSKGRNIPQSFLITPKLLPDLVPNEARNITVLFIFNGPFNIPQALYNMYMKHNDLFIEPEQPQFANGNGTVKAIKGKHASVAEDDDGDEDE